MVDGNEAVKMSQVSSMSSPSSTNSYGVVKVMTDEQLDAYMNMGRVISFELTPASPYIRTFDVSGQYADGVVTITGSCSTGDTGGYSLNITTIPEEYRPTSDVTGSCQVVTNGWPDTHNASVVAHTNGIVSVSYMSDAFYDVKNISITYRVDNGAEEPEGIYAVTVEQAIRYLNKSN